MNNVINDKASTALLGFSESPVKTQRFSKLALADYSTCKATANKTPSSTNRVVAAMQTTAYKVAAAFSFAATFLSNVVRSIANLAIGAANFAHGRIFTKETFTAKPVEMNLEPKKEVPAVIYVGSQTASEQLVATEKSADQAAPTVETAPKEEAPTVVDTKTEEETVVNLPAAGEELAAPEVASVTVEAVSEKMAPVSAEEKSQITLGKVAKYAALSILLFVTVLSTAPRWVLP